MVWPLRLLSCFLTGPGLCFMRLAAHLGFGLCRPFPRLLSRFACLRVLEWSVAVFSSFGWLGFLACFVLACLACHASSFSACRPCLADGIGGSCGLLGKGPRVLDRPLVAPPDHASPQAFFSTFLGSWSSRVSVGLSPVPYLPLVPPECTSPLDFFFFGRWVFSSLPGSRGSRLFFGFFPIDFVLFFFFCFF